MNFKDFLTEGYVRKSKKDILLVKAIIKTADRDLTFLQGLKINGASARKIMANYYDVLRSILEAMAPLDGYKIYSHEAFAYYLKEKRENLIADKFDRFRKIRNSINYYGKEICVEETKINVEEINLIIKNLKTKYLADIE